jgi:hypothetical protein
LSSAIPSSTPPSRSPPRTSAWKRLFFCQIEALETAIHLTEVASLYGTTSHPFPVPTTGKIAIKVINHYGDEVMKVFGV